MYTCMQYNIIIIKVLQLIHPLVFIVKIAQNLNNTTSGEQNLTRDWRFSNGKLHYLFGVKPWRRFSQWPTLSSVNYLSIICWSSSSVSSEIFFSNGDCNNFNSCNEAAKDVHACLKWSPFRVSSLLLAKVTAVWMMFLISRPLNSPSENSTLRSSILSYTANMGYHVKLI